MTEKRFVYYEHKGADYILDTPNTELDFIEMLGDALEPEEIVDKLNELNQLNYNLTENAREYQKIARIVDKQNKQLEKENEELKKQLKREETDKKRLMSYLMRYKGFSFDEIVEDFLDASYYDNWWKDGFYEFCWNEYLKEKGFDGCDVE